MSVLDKLIKEIKSHHKFQKNTNPFMAELSDEVLTLPDDLKIFFREFSYVQLFPGSERDSRFVFHCYSGFRLASIDVLGRSIDDPMLVHWHTICDVGDGNHVAISLQHCMQREWEILDCFHETFLELGYRRIIAKSFTEFLERALLSENSLFWLADTQVDYGYR